MQVSELSWSATASGEPSPPPPETGLAKTTSRPIQNQYHHHPIAIIPDCLEHILKFLNTSDKGRSAQVCQLWKDTCYRRSVWRGTTATIRLVSLTAGRARDALHSIHARGIKKLRVKGHKNNLDTITRIFQTLQSLDIGGCYNTTDEGLSKAFQIPQPMLQLKELGLAFCTSLTDSSLATALQKCPNLESLNLQGCTRVRLEDATVKSSLRRCMNLKVLNLQGCKLLNFQSFAGLFTSNEEEEEEREGEGPGPTNLNELSLRDCDYVNDCCLQYLCSHLTFLESLDISFCISVTDQSLGAIAKSLHQLQHLYLQAVDHISSNGMKLVVAKCTKIKTLDLSFCDWMDNECLDVISKSPLCETLEQLDLSCANITDEGILVLSRSLRRLKHLKIGQCNGLTNDSLLYISSCLSTLVTIDIYGCGFACRAINSIWDTLPDLLVVDNSILPSDRSS